MEDMAEKVDLDREKETIVKTGEGRYGGTGTESRECIAAEVESDFVNKSTLVR